MTTDYDCNSILEKTYCGMHKSGSYAKFTVCAFIRRKKVKAKKELKRTWRTRS